MKASDLHIHLVLAALAYIRSFIFVAGIPLTVIPGSPSLVPITDSEFQSPSHEALALISGPLNKSSTAPSRNSSPGGQSNQSIATPIKPSGLIPFHVKGSPTTLLFHTFGRSIPLSMLIQSVSLSLTVIIEPILEGKGQDLIPQGVFMRTHVMPTGDKVTISVADFRELRKPMTYLMLRDTLSAIGSFVTEKEYEATTLSYEIEVEGKGYVGTGHVDFDAVRRADS